MRKNKSYPATGCIAIIFKTTIGYWVCSILYFGPNLETHLLLPSNMVLIKNLVNPRLLQIKIRRSRIFPCDYPQSTSNDNSAIRNKTIGKSFAKSAICKEWRPLYTLPAYGHFIHAMPSSSIMKIISRRKWLKLGMIPTAVHCSRFFGFQPGKKYDTSTAQLALTCQRVLIIL